MKKYTLYQSDYIIENQDEIIKDLNTAHANFKNAFPSQDSSLTATSQGYRLYNIFAITSPSPHFYQIYSELRNLIREHFPTEKIWFQSWLNFHDENEVLGWHNHNWDYHGYISIDPQDTNTVFEGYTIENKVGQIYLGPGGINHKVENISPFVGKRLTIGFDLLFEPWKPYAQFSLLPLL